MRCARVLASKAQSAMEYLMTYGWAILIMAVVLVSLFSLGIFNKGSVITSACLANPGFFCSRPLLNTTGALNITVGQLSGSTITLTSIGCSNSTAPPIQTTGLNSIVLVSGESVPLVLNCPITANTVGTSFTGTVWIGYTASGLPGQTAMIARVSTAVATGAAVGKSGTGSAGGGSSSNTIKWLSGWMYREPITISNGGGSLSDYQILVKANTASLISAGHMNANGNDIVVTDNSGQTQIPFYLAGPINSASTNIWINVPTIAAGNTVIYMYYGNSVATSQSSGINTFNLFDSFPGSTLNSSKWSAYQINNQGPATGQVVVNNKLELLYGTTWWGSDAYTNPTYPTSTAWELDVNVNWAQLSSVGNCGGTYCDSPSIIYLRSPSATRDTTYYGEPGYPSIFLQFNPHNSQVAFQAGGGGNSITSSGSYSVSTNTWFNASIQVYPGTGSNAVAYEYIGGASQASPLQIPANIFTNISSYVVEFHTGNYGSIDEMFIGNVILRQISAITPTTSVGVEQTV
ncbi:MAG: DUF2341 domain-containing protein [Candidatus Micrarchaeota archaeon]|nr:DUF2341 domain-containing protein [Candidatus Micrarchaeota archaeon]